MSNEKGRKKEIVLAAATCILAITAIVLTVKISPAYGHYFTKNDMEYERHFGGGLYLRKIIKYEEDAINFKVQIDGVPVRGIYLEGSWCDNAENITSMSLPNSVEAFRISDFEKIESLEIPDTVLDLSVRNCEALESINIPDGARKIDLGGCKSLTSVEFPDELPVYHYNYGAPDIPSINLAGCESLTSVRIPYGIESLERSMFYGCSSLTDVEIPDSVTKINDGAFEYCTSLTSAVIPDSVELIKGSAFDGCDSLTVVSLPAGIKISGDCSWLDKIVYRVFN